MKKYLLTITMLLLVCTALHAQDYSKMSRYVRERVRKSPTPSLPKVRGTETVGQQRMLVLVEGEEGALRGRCLRHQGNIHIALVPIDSLAALSEDTRVSRIEAHRSNAHMHCDISREKTEVAKVAAGMGVLSQAYDGSGVLVGVQDISFDLNHPNFLSKKDGRQRIMRLWDMLDNTPLQEYDSLSTFPLGTFYNSSEAITKKDHTRDATIHYHGTHVAGIAVGSGCNTPFTGMAPESDIYLISTVIENNDSLLPQHMEDIVTDEIFLLAFQNMFDYADSIGVPCVANYSIGGEYDIADADPLAEKYIEKMTGPGKIIVASAGNDGERRCFLPISKTDSIAGGLFVPNAEAEQLRLHVSTTGRLLLKFTDVANTASDNYKTFALGFKAKGIYRKGDTVNMLKWNEWYKYESAGNLGSGTTVEIYSGVDGYNSDRVGYDIYLNPANEDFTGHSYVIELTGDGVEAYAFVENGTLNGFYSNNFRLKGAELGGTVNSPATLPSVIAVGSTSWRTYWTSYQGRKMSAYNGSNGKWTTFSSIGPSVTGAIKPDLCAPGQAVISSLDSHYKPTGGFPNYIYDKSGSHNENNGKDYGWLVLSGTSMASPIVAGTIALWLQADPTLTRERILDIVAKTATHPDPTLSYPNNYYGLGEINAYRGLLDILGLTGIKGLSATHLSTAVVRPIGNHSILITLDDTPTKEITCKVFATNSQLIYSATLPPHSTTYTLPLNTGKGIYAVQLDGMGSTLIRVE